MRKVRFQVPDYNPSTGKLDMSISPWHEGVLVKDSQDEDGWLHVVVRKPKEHFRKDGTPYIIYTNTDYMVKRHWIAGEKPQAPEDELDQFFNAMEAEPLSKPDKK